MTFGLVLFVLNLGDLMRIGVCSRIDRVVSHATIVFISVEDVLEFVEWPLHGLGGLALLGVAAADGAFAVGAVRSGAAVQAVGVGRGLTVRKVGRMPASGNNIY